MNLTLRMQGVEDIQRELGLLVNPEKISNTLRSSAILVEAEAKRYCPVRTNFLHNSITSRKIDTLTWEVAATAKYADYVEFGTFRMQSGTPQDPYIYTSSRGKYPSYRPFLRSALWDCQDRIIDMFNEAINEK